LKIDKALLVEMIKQMWVLQIR